MILRFRMLLLSIGTPVAGSMTNPPSGTFRNFEPELRIDLMAQDGREVAELLALEEIEIHI